MGNNSCTGIGHNIGRYRNLQKIGEGYFSKVYKVVDTKDSTDEFTYYAMKKISKKMIKKQKHLAELYEFEVAILRQINHPNILHLHDLIDTKSYHCLIVNYCNNGDLKQYIKKNKYLTESEAVYFLKQIMNGFKELHKHKIMHRDFKSANIFIHDDVLVIGDFGLSNIGEDQDSLKIGTPINAAPEVLNGGHFGVYDTKVDLWSIGVTFYEMLFGYNPFFSNDDSIKTLELMQKHHSGKNLYFNSEIPISEPCKQLLKSLIEFDPKKRIEWHEFFHHQLFRLHDENGDLASSKGKSSEVKGRNRIPTVILFKSSRSTIERNFKENQVKESGKFIGDN